MCFVCVCVFHVFRVCVCVSCVYVVLCVYVVSCVCGLSSDECGWLRQVEPKIAELFLLSLC